MNRKLTNRKQEEQSMADNTYDFSKIAEIIPAKFHAEVKQLIEDYTSLSDEEMYEKYNLEDCWFTIEDYKEEKEDRDLISLLIVNFLVDKNFILQLDYKENLEEYIDEIKPFWSGDLKIVNLDLDNDQFYLAKVPKDMAVKDLFGASITEDKALTEKYLERKNARLKSQAKKDYTIWQMKRDCKVHYPKKSVITFITLCIVFLVSAVLSIYLAIVLDPGSAISIVCYIVCVLSLIAFAVTLGSFKGHLTWQYAFVKDENGDVYFIDYTDPNPSRDFHYYGEIPGGYKNEPGPMISTPAKVVGLTYFLIFFPVECKACLNSIRNSKADVRIAEACHKYGYKITSVPEIKKKSYYTFIRLKMLKDGKEVEFENQFDNCYEGYDEMVDYLDKHFAHDNPEQTKKKTAQINRLLFIGIGIIAGSAALFGINALIHIPWAPLIASFGVLVGIGFIGGFLSEKGKR